MSTTDIIIVAVYVCGLFAVGISVGLRETLQDFLILSRRAPMWLVVFSVVATWVGVGTTVATAASGYDNGISLGLTAGIGGLIGVLAASVFAPTVKRFGDRYEAHTIGDFYRIRYSPRTQAIVGTLIVFIYLLLTAAQFVGLTSLLRVWSGQTFAFLIWFCAGSTIIYTAFAGIKSDFYTDVIHFFVKTLVLFGILLPLAASRVGGIFSVRQRLPASYFDPMAYGGASFLIAGVIFGIGIVFVTMEIWQRIYASTSARSASVALAISGIIIVSFYGLAAFLGLVARILLPDLPDRNLALFALMTSLLPSGILGLGLAAFVAVFISAANTTIMVASATIAKDFYRGWYRPFAGDRELLTVSRASTFVAGILSLAAAMIVQDVVALSVNAMFILLVLLPGVVGGFFWSGATEPAALWSIVSGLATIVVFLPRYPAQAFAPGFAVSLIVFLVVSARTKHAASEDIALAGRATNAHDAERV